MPTYVALLRGIAPTNPKMRNAELRKVFEGLSFDAVRTVISSGNVLFDAASRSSAGLERRIEAALEEHLGAPCSTIVRSRRRIDQLAASDVFAPYRDGPTDRCHVTFLQRDPGSTAAPSTGPGAHIVAVRGREVFSVIDSTAPTTPNLMARLERTYGTEITTRTWRTVHRIATAFDP